MLRFYGASFTFFDFFYQGLTPNGVSDTGIYKTDTKAYMKFDKDFRHTAPLGQNVGRKLISGNNPAP